MVVFVDLEDEGEPPERGVTSQHWSLLNSHGHGYGGGFDILPAVRGMSLFDSQDGRDNPNKCKSVAEALGCYPIIISIASHIDLNTLDALSLTCRQIRVNLLQYRNQLLNSTLRCENEDLELNPEHTFRYRARAADWYFVDSRRGEQEAGKAGDCARDMVRGCRKCGKVVCRNCTIKAPAPVLLRKRHRRLCKTCQQAPLSCVITLASDQTSSSLSNRTTTVTAETLKIASCSCPSEGVWLCQPCGRNVGRADGDYESIWKWRTRYLAGGLGLGVGEGLRGVPCGRSGDCLAAREVEQEIDCDAEDARESDFNTRAASPSSSPPGSSSANGSVASGHTGPGYERHEIEGIGGVMKKKLVKMVKIGASVPEYREERLNSTYMVSEIEGKSRSWCGWCWRVVPGAKDVIE